MDFHGAKIALLHSGQILTIHRDDKPGLVNANLWDLPGGGRDNQETPEQTIVREIHEELGFVFDPSTIIHHRRFPSQVEPGLFGVFMVAPISQANIEAIVFGDEGQGWKMMDIDKFLRDPTVIPAIQGRLQDYLDARNA